MKVSNYRDTQLQKVEEEGAQGVAVRWVISKDDGAQNFFMRVFDVQPGGHTPYHRHPWEHEVFILDGRAEVVAENGRHAARAGDVVFILPEEYHQFRNETDEPLRFICLIPKVD
jgi:quercetin dioxygenase-like cupin family protein